MIIVSWGCGLIRGYARALAVIVLRQERKGVESLRAGEGGEGKGNRERGGRRAGTVEEDRG